MVWSILPCAFCLISEMVAMLCSSFSGSPGWSGVHQGTLVLAHEYALERAVLVDREHLDRQLLVAAQRERGGVHDAQVLRHGLVEADASTLFRGRMLFRV